MPISTAAAPVEAALALASSLDMPIKPNETVLLMEAIARECPRGKQTRHATGDRDVVWSVLNAETLSVAERAMREGLRMDQDGPTLDRGSGGHEGHARQKPSGLSMDQGARCPRH